MLGRLLRNHTVLMVACLLMPLGLLAAVYGLDLPVGSAFIFALLLVCPLAHLLMMRRMGHGHGAQHEAMDHRPPQAGPLAAQPGGPGRAGQAVGDVRLERR